MVSFANAVPMLFVPERLIHAWNERIGIPGLGKPPNVP